MDDITQIKSVDDMIAYAQKQGHVETKSNEVVDPTTNANWYNAYGLSNAIKDMTAKRGNLLQALQAGFEGSNLPDTYPVPYNITNQFMLGKTVWRDGTRPAISATALTDASGTITQVPFILQLDVNDEMIANSTDKQIFDKVVEMASKSAVSTMEGCILNGDTETGATGNVNSDDQAPATTFGSASYHSLKIDHGIRELAINGTGIKKDVGAFDSDDLQAVRALLRAQYAMSPSDLLFIFEPTSYLVAQTDDALKLAYATKAPSIDGALMTPFGVEAIAHDLFPKTEADGKVSSTAGNNTLGGFACVYRPAIRWGFGKDVMVEVERIQGYGFTITVTMKFSFVILDSAKTVAVGYNMTIS